MNSLQKQSLRTVRNELRQQGRTNNKILKLLSSYEHLLTRADAKNFIKKLQENQNRLERVVAFLNKYGPEMDNNSPQKKKPKHKK